MNVSNKYRSSREDQKGMSKLMALHCVQILLLFGLDRVLKEFSYIIDSFPTFRFPSERILPGVIVRHLVVTFWEIQVFTRFPNGKKSDQIRPKAHPIRSTAIK